MMAAEKHISMFGIALGCSVSVTIAATCLLGAQGGAAIVAIFVILHGAGYGVTSITRSLITANFFGLPTFWCCIRNVGRDVYVRLCHFTHIGGDDLGIWWL